MGIRLNNKSINDFIISNKSINRIMLNDVRIWPENDLDNNEINIDVIYKTNPNNSICFEYIQMWNAQLELINFDNVERIGNPEGDLFPLNYEVVLNNNDTICNIKTNIGLFNFTKVPSTIEQDNTNNNYAWSWLPNNVGQSVKKGLNNGYRYLVSSTHLVNEQNYFINITSEGSDIVKYFAITPGYHGNGVNALSYEPYKLLYRNNIVFDYTNKNDFQTNEMLTVDGVNWKARYIFGTDGSVRKVWHRNWYLTPNYLGEMYLCKEFKIQSADKNTVGRTMVEATLLDVIEKSDGNGFIKLEYENISDITIQMSRNIKSAQNFHIHSGVLIYDENNKLINSEGLTPDVRFFLNNAITMDSLDIGLLNQEKNILALTSDSGWYNADYGGLSGFGLENIGTQTNWQYVLGATLSTIKNPGAITNLRLQSNFNIKIIALPICRLPNRVDVEFITKLSINNNIIKEYQNDELNLLKETEIKTSEGKKYIRRYFYNVLNNDIFVAYALANQELNTYKTFRDIYVYDTYTGLMKQITIDELLTGKYPEGEYDSSNDIYKYVFILQTPIPNSLNYVSMQYMSIVDKNGDQVTAYKEIITSDVTNTLELSKELILLDNNEYCLIRSTTGQFSPQYTTHNIITHSADPWLSANDVKGKTIEHELTIGLQRDDYILIFCPFRYYSGNVYTSYKTLKYKNNNHQLIKNIPDPATDLASARAYETKSVKGVVYYRKIMATISKAYVVWSKNLITLSKDTTPLFLYNEEFDTMIEFTPERIIAEDKTDGTTDLPFDNLATEISFYLSPVYNTPLTYFGLGNAMIYIERPDKSIKLVNPNTLTSRYFKRGVNVGTDENDITALIEFEDEDGNIFRLSTDAGTYNNSTNYHLWNFVSNGNNYDTQIQYGYLTHQPMTNYLNRDFKFTLKSTAKIIAFAFQSMYIGLNSSTVARPSAIAGKFTYNNEIIYHYQTDALAKVGNYIEGMFSRYIIFPEKQEVLKVKTPNNGNAQQTGVVHTPHYLWDRGTLEHREFTIEELINLKKDILEYDRESASILTPVAEVNSFNFKFYKTFSETTETYGSIGNMILYDENYDIIELTHKETTRNVAADVPLGEKYLTSTWVDKDGNEYHVMTNFFQHLTAGWSIDNLLTPPKGFVANTATMWLSRPNIKFTNPLKYGNMKFVASNKKIGAIALSHGYYLNSGVKYIYPFSGAVYDNNGNEIDIWRYEKLADLNNDLKFTINGKTWLKRFIVKEDGSILTTFIPFF